MSDLQGSTAQRGSLVLLLIRGGIGGVLMGLANLVPGISGGTMLLASGVYTRFIQAIAEVTTLRFRLRPILLLSSIGLGAVGVIVLLAGPVAHLVTTHRWVMYSLFIGLTLGGVPLVWRMARPASPALVAGAAGGFAAMALMAFIGPAGAGASNLLLLFIAGVAGASAMILPGVSGAYLLLILGQYEVILGGVDQVKQGLSGDTALILDSMRIIVPVGLGVLAGVVGISNLVGWLLRRFPKPTLGVLLGLLFGSVLGIWPFQTVVDHGASRQFFAPAAGQAAIALGLVAAGLALTVAIDRLGGDVEKAGR